MSQSTKRPSRDDRRASRIEAVIGLVSAALVLAILATLVVQAKRSGPGFPQLSVQEAPASTAPGQLRFRVSNTGERAAANVTVALTLRDGDAIVDKRTALIDFVPIQSEASGAFVIAPDDGGLTPSLTVESYIDP